MYESVLENRDVYDEKMYIKSKGFHRNRCSKYMLENSRKSNEVKYIENTFTSNRKHKN